VIELHRLSLNALLWRLEAFAEVEPSPPSLGGSEPYSPRLVEEILRIGCLSRTARGTVPALAERYGRSTGSLRVAIWRARHGQLRAYWRAA